MRDIVFYSLCEHHLAPFFGVAHVAYIPSKNGSITGISKIVRLVRTAAARLQLQERLTSTIADTLVRVPATRRGARAHPGRASVHVHAGSAGAGFAGGHLRGAGHIPQQRCHPSRGAGPDRSSRHLITGTLGGARMIPAEGLPQVLMLRDLADVRAALERARVSAVGVEIMDNEGPVPGRPGERPGHPRCQHPQAGDAVPGRRGGHLARSCTNGKGRRPTASSWALWPSSSGSCPSCRPSRSGCETLAAVDRGGARATTTTRCRPARRASTSSGGPLLMGVLNVTPDSFSDGGLYSLGLRGASRPDWRWRTRERPSSTWGESRPAREPTRCPLEEELERVLPVVKALAAALPGRVSVDTYKARVAAEALAAGAYMVNDISALRMDPEMVAVVRDADCPGDAHAHAGRAQDHAAGPRLRGRGAGAVRLLRGAAELGGGQWAQGREPAHRPGSRLRQDDRPQPGDPAAIWRPSGRWAGRSWWGRRASGSWGRYWASTTRKERDVATAATTVDGRQPPGRIS